MLEIFSLGKILFPAGKTINLLKSAQNITNSTNPMRLAGNISVTIIDCCTPPPYRLAFHCLAQTSLIFMSISNPAPTVVGCTLAIADELYKECF